MTWKQSLRPAKKLGWHAAVCMWAMMYGVGCDRTLTPSAPPQTEEQFLELCSMYPGANLALGRRHFLKHCSVCHQPTGAGASKAIPPLRGHLPNLAAHPSGRSYLSQLVLFGLNGPIRVNGQKFYNAMPPLGALMSDAELAATLNYAQVSWGNSAVTRGEDLVTQADIAHARQQPHSAGQTLAVRRRLFPEGEPQQAPPKASNEPASAEP